VINDSPIDDRDVGVVHLGGSRVLLTWFSVGQERYAPAAEHPDWLQTTAGWTDDVRRRWTGSFLRRSDDGGETWSEAVRVPVSAPHGPIVLHDGRLLYLGKTRYNERLHASDRRGDMQACASTDEGTSWHVLGTVPPPPGATGEMFIEAHAVELLPSHRLIGLVRLQTGAVDHVDRQRAAPWRHLDFSLLQTESKDGGRTWTAMRPLGVMGSPPHLLRHSSGTLVCVYGYRQPPYGQRAIISDDGGRTWSQPWVVCDDGPDRDLGYPSSVELPDGSIFTVYYQKQSEREKPGILWSRWALPA
jgi:hypothetical protein